MCIPKELALLEVGNREKQLELRIITRKERIFNIVYKMSILVDDKREIVSNEKI